MINDIETFTRNINFGDVFFTKKRFEIDFFCPTNAYVLAHDRTSADNVGYVPAWTQGLQ